MQVGNIVIEELLNYRLAFFYLIVKLQNSEKAQQPIKKTC